jgi:hypothetical protein
VLDELRVVHLRVPVGKPSIDPTLWLLIIVVVLVGEQFGEWRLIRVLLFTRVRQVIASPIT